MATTSQPTSARVRSTCTGRTRTPFSRWGGRYWRPHPSPRAPRQLYDTVDLGAARPPARSLQGKTPERSGEPRPTADRRARLLTTPSDLGQLLTTVASRSAGFTLGRSKRALLSPPGTHKRSDEHPHENPETLGGAGLRVRGAPRMVRSAQVRSPPDLRETANAGGRGTGVALI